MTNLQVAPLDNALAKAPGHGQAYWLMTADSVRLRVGVWTGDNAGKGTILLFPGRADFIEKIGHAVSELHASGYTVCVIEFRGLGLSDRLLRDVRAGHVNQFSDYQKDVAALMGAASDLQLPDPMYLLGNSMGGCIGLRAVLDGLPVAACAFTSPMWRVWLTPFQRAIAPPITRIACAMGFAGHYAPGKNGENETLALSFEENDITGDRDMFTHLQHVNRELPEHWIGGPTIGWLQQALQETHTLSTLPAPNLPCIAFSAGKDRLVDSHATKQRMDAWDAGLHINVAEARHDLLRESDSVRRSVISQIIHFFDNHR